MLIYEANNESHAERNSSISDDNFYDLALSRVLNAVEWEKNRTSNIMWSLGNESGKQENWLKVIAQLRKVDATRPVHYEGITGNNRSGSMNPKWKPATEDEVYPDVQSSMYSFPNTTTHPMANYMGSFSNELAASLIKSVMLCEFSHSNTNGLGTLDDYTNMFRSSERSIGGCIWDFVDQSIWTKPADTVISEEFLNENGCYLGYGTGNGGSTGVAGTDWGEAITDGNGCADGIITATRELQPEMSEVKKLYQVLNFTADENDLLQKIVYVQNEAYAINADEYEYHWILTENGDVIDSGTATAPNLAARPASADILTELPTKAISIPYTLPETLRPGAEYFLTVQVCLKKDTSWAMAGHVVAEEQFKLPLEENTSVSCAVVKNPTELTVNHNEDTITVSGNGFSVHFSDGEIICYEVNGETLLTQGPTPEFWRVLQKGDVQGGAVNTIGSSVWKDVESGTPVVSEPEMLSDGSVKMISTGCSWKTECSNV